MASFPRAGLRDVFHLERKGVSGFAGFRTSEKNEFYEISMRFLKLQAVKQPYAT